MSLKEFILQDLLQDFTPDLTVFLGKILKLSCQEFINNLGKCSEDPVGIYIQDLGKVVK